MYGECTCTLTMCKSRHGVRWHQKQSVIYLLYLFILKENVAIVPTDASWIVNTQSVKLTGGPGGPFCPEGPGAPMGTSPYRGQTAAHVLFTELANMDICSRTTFLQTSITCWAGRVGPCVRNDYHIHHWKEPNCGTCKMEYYRTGHAEARLPLWGNAANKANNISRGSLWIYSHTKWNSCCESLLTAG